MNRYLIFLLSTCIFLACNNASEDHPQNPNTPNQEEIAFDLSKDLAKKWIMTGYHLDGYQKARSISEDQLKKLGNYLDQMKGKTFYQLNANKTYSADDGTGRPYKGTYVVDLDKKTLTLTEDPIENESPTPVIFSIIEANHKTLKLEDESKLQIHFSSN